MASEWVVKALGDLATLHNEQVNPADDPDCTFQHFSIPAFDGARQPVLERGSSIGSNKFTVPSDAVLVSKLNPRIPRVWMPAVSTTVPAVSSTEFLVLRPRKGTDRRYLKFLCLSPRVRSEMESRVTGTSGSHQRVRPEDALTIRARVPEDITEQRAIAHILGTLDDKIDLNGRMNETLEATARIIFKSWFVDFEPVGAKLEGRWRRGESLPGFPAHLYDLFPDRLVESELGEIPEGWETLPFADTVEVIGGGTPKTSVADYWNGDIPWFSLVDAPRDADVWVVDTEKKITRVGVENSSAGVLPEGTTIISARGTVGRIALAGVPMAMNQSCYGLRGKVDRRGFYTYFAARVLVSDLQQRTHGSVFDTITRDTFKSVAIASPPSNLIRAYERSVTSVLEGIRRNILESRTLAALRDVLLPKLISGDFTVQDPERYLRERQG
jgi:type I restriction enzyme S subunit